MRTIHGAMTTQHSSHYIARLCEHLEKLTLGHDHRGVRRRTTAGGPPLTSVTRTPTGARLEFTWGECVLEATESGLVVDVTAVDESAIAMAQRMIGERLENFAHREGATVEWRDAPT
jgi:hypothetical protein